MILEVILLSLTLKIYSLGVPLVTVTCVSVYIYYARTQTRRELFSGIGWSGGYCGRIPTGKALANTVSISCKLTTEGWEDDVINHCYRDEET